MSNQDNQVETPDDSSKPAQPCQSGDSDRAEGRPGDEDFGGQLENASQLQADPSSLSPTVEAGVKGYLRKVGKIMIFMTILGSIFITFAAWLIVSTLNRIISAIPE